MRKKPKPKLKYVPNGGWLRCPLCWCKLMRRAAVVYMLTLWHTDTKQTLYTAHYSYALSDRTPNTNGHCVRQPTSNAIVATVLYKTARTNRVHIAKPGERLKLDARATPPMPPSAHVAGTHTYTRAFGSARTHAHTVSQAHDQMLSVKWCLVMLGAHICVVRRKYNTLAHHARFSCSIDGLLIQLRRAHDGRKRPQKHDSHSNALAALFSDGGHCSRDGMCQN